MSDFKIKIIEKNQLETILPLVFELNSERISIDVLKERLKEMLAMGGYQCIGAYDDEELIGIFGVWFLTKLYAGKHIEPDNVFIKEAYRSQGVGKLMMDWMFDYAKAQGCIGAEVNCYKTNVKGNKFWEDQGFKPLANHLFVTF
ncbi:MAG: GNAT family N-acetyltransferase [Flavobacteriaceae bacterium]